MQPSRKPQFSSDSLVEASMRLCGRTSGRSSPQAPCRAACRGQIEFKKGEGPQRGAKWREIHLRYSTMPGGAAGSICTSVSTWADPLIKRSISHLLPTCIECFDQTKEKNQHSSVRTRGRKTRAGEQWPNHTNNSSSPLANKGTAATPPKAMPALCT